MWPSCVVIHSFITACKRSCGKVMFFTPVKEGAVLSRGCCEGGFHEGGPWRNPPSGRSTSRQYASYWNAFLFYVFVCHSFSYFVQLPVIHSLILCICPSFIHSVCLSVSSILLVCHPFSLSICVVHSKSVHVSAIHSPSALTPQCTAKLFISLYAARVYGKCWCCGTGQKFMVTFSRVNVN